MLFWRSDQVGETIRTLDVFFALTALCGHPKHVRDAAVATRIADIDKPVSGQTRSSPAPGRAGHRSPVI